VKRSLMGIALVLAVSSIALATATAQEKTPAGAKSMKTRTVEGTVKSAQADGIVVSGKDQAGASSTGKDREWTFAFNDKTTVRRGQTAVAATDLKVGDKVTVGYTEQDGKVIAHSVMVKAGEAGKAPTSAREVPASKK